MAALCCEPEPGWRQKLARLCTPRETDLLAKHLLKESDFDENESISITEFYSVLNRMYEAIGTSEVRPQCTGRYLRPQLPGSWISFGRESHRRSLQRYTKSQSRRTRQRCTVFRGHICPDWLTRWFGYFMQVDVGQQGACKGHVEDKKK